MTFEKKPMILQSVIEDARPQPLEDWDAEIAEDPYPPGQMLEINGEHVYVFNRELKKKNRRMSIFFYTTAVLMTTNFFFRKDAFFYIDGVHNR